MLNLKIMNSDWRQELNAFLHSYRRTPHSTTGVSPSFLLFGANRTNRLPSFKCEESGRYSDSVHFAQLTDKLAKYKSKMYGKLLRFNRLASQNYKSIRRALQKIIFKLLKRRIV